MTIRNQNRGYRRRASNVVLAAAAAAAVTSLALAPSAARAAQTGNAVTISLSGSTAMRNFTTDPGFSFLEPGTSITLNSGPGAAPVTYTAPSGPGASFQLAAGDTGALTANNVLALRIEWHEQGSVEGIVELADSQINDSLFSNATYNPSAPGGPIATFVNRNKFGGSNTNGNPIPSTVNGFFLDLHPNDPIARNPGAQNRVQMGISDVNAAQGFSRAGTPAFNRAPNQSGFGKGNPALIATPANLVGVGVRGGRKQLVDEGALNMRTDVINPSTGTNYTAGPWNTAGIGNLHNETVAITATTFSANPGTGLTRINRSDAQWLQATGRLRNGADFNSATRDVNSGTLNVATLNVGLDPSFAVGENDGGLGGGTTEDTLGAGIRFSNKASGGSNVRPTVQNARMGIGHLSISDYRSGSGGANNGNRPLRALEYRDDDNDVADGSNAPFGFADPASGQFTRISAQNIVNGSYAIYQNQTYVTVQRPDAAFAGDSVATWSARTDNPTTGTGIKGDNAGNDVFDVRQNILGSVATFPSASVNNPADALIRQSFILPQFMLVRKDRDGINQSVSNPGYDSLRSGQFLGSGLANNFGAPDPSTVTTGSSTSYYGNLGPFLSDGVTPRPQGAIQISNDNFLFGDFDQRAAAGGISGKGVRDFSDLDVARRAQAALQAGPGTSMFVGGVNGTAVSNATFAEIGFGPTKGDLIVLGDMNADGTFTGEDLRRMARGTSLADSTGSNVLTGNFADSVRNGVLRKNAALDQLHTGGLAASTAQRAEARAIVLNTNGTVAADLDPSGANAFNKFDVNRDGGVSRRDAKIVDFFVGKDYRNLNDQLGAVLRTDNGSGGAGSGADLAGQAFANGVAPLDPAADANLNISRRAIDLVDVELNDTGNISHTADGGGDSDMKRMVFNLQGRDITSSRTGNEVDGVNKLLNGDANFDGSVGQADFGLLASSFGQGGRKWSGGDFDFDGQVGQSDFGLLASNFGLSLSGGGPNLQSGDYAALVAFGESIGVAVPEPTAVGLLAAAAGGLLARRRRRQA